MKKNYFFAFIMLFYLNAQSQITLTSATHSLHIGDSISIMTENSTSISVSQSGANQTWDFSSLNGSLYEYYLTSPSNGTISNEYPNATMMLKDTSTKEAYLSSNTNYIGYEGYYIPGSFKIIYSDVE